MATASLKAPLLALTTGILPGPCQPLFKKGLQSTTQRCLYPPLISGAAHVRTQEALRSQQNTLPGRVGSMACTRLSYFLSAAEDNLR